MKTLTLIIFSVLCISAHAQKLPNVQQVSLRAPANVKVDGKATEWSDTFQAYNKATDVYYTLSNDNENLYLTLKAKEYQVIINMFKHGVRFTVNHSKSKKDASPVVISYPAMDQKDRGPVIDLLGSRYFEMGRNPVDNSVEALNKLLKVRSKFIRVEGISDITEKEIAIYNDKGIVAVSAFEKPFAYVYELAIPLKKLSLNTNDPSFSYQVKINYPDPNEKQPPPPPPNVLVITHPQGANEAVSDFWGEYTLAK